MKKTLVNIGLLLFVALCFFMSCQEKEEYPVVPTLVFTKASIFRDTVSEVDSTLVLFFSYTDGDGDLGVIDTTEPKNFIISYYKMVNGQWKIGTRRHPKTGKIDTINFNTYIPYLAPANYTGWIKGTIEDTIKPVNPTSTKIYDTIKFKAFIIDRAGNKSDTAVTDPIIIKNR